MRVLIKVLAVATLFASGIFYPIAEISSLPGTPSAFTGIEKPHVRASLVRPLAQQGRFPERVGFRTAYGDLVGAVSYTLDPRMQDVAERLLQRYRPDYAAVVAIEPHSGRVLALSGYSRDDDGFGNIALLSSYPAASILKVITAAAAIDQGIATPRTEVPYNGRPTTLFRRDVLEHRDNQWTNRPSLQTAFARSVNTAFGRLGIYYVGGETLYNYAVRFGFDQGLDTDLPTDSGRILLDLEDTWAIAEAASGYTREVTLSPLHGAMIAAAVINGGVMVEPYLVEAIHGEVGTLMYHASDNRAIWQAISPEAAEGMLELMRETVRSGTGRQYFRDFHRGAYADVDVGGKTGSLTGMNPRGRNEWFIAYGARGEKSVAVAALTVNKEKWTVKPAFLARQMIEAWFAPDPG